MNLDDLVDELWLSIAASLAPIDLLALQCVCRRAAELPTDGACWRQLCAKRWESKPRFRLTPARERWLDANQPLTWQRRYYFFEADAKRTTISDAELQTLTWLFNFTPAAGCAIHPAELRRPHLCPPPSEPAARSPHSQRPGAGHDEPRALPTGQPIPGARLPSPHVPPRPSRAADGGRRRPPAERAAAVRGSADDDGEPHVCAEPNFPRRTRAPPRRRRLQQVLEVSLSVYRYHMYLSTPASAGAAAASARGVNP